MAAQEYQLDKEANQINSIINGAVVANAATALSEAEKAQARENIGASAIGTGIRILSHFDTLQELEQTITNPKPGDVYSVGTTFPYNMYFWDSLDSLWVNYGAVRSEDITTRMAENVVVPVSAWEEDTEIFEDYPYKALIPLAEVLSDDFPIVVFDPFDAATGNFCPVAYTFDGRIEIFAKVIPSAAITLPAITFIVFGGA